MRTMNEHVVRLCFVAQFGNSGGEDVSATGTISSVVYHQGTDDVITATSSQPDRNSRYVALY